MINVTVVGHDSVAGAIVAGAIVGVISITRLASAVRIANQADVQFIWDVPLSVAGLFLGERAQLDEVSQACLFTGTLVLQDCLVDLRRDIFTETWI